MFAVLRSELSSDSAKGNACKFCVGSEDRNCNKPMSIKLVKVFDGSSSVMFTALYPRFPILRRCACYLITKDEIRINKSIKENEQFTRIDELRFYTRIILILSLHELLEWFLFTPLLFVLPPSLNPFT